MDVIGLPLAAIFTVVLSVVIVLVRGYRGSFASRGARNRERERAGTVLNPLSNSETASVARQEVQSAIDAVLNLRFK